jgi:hypothetical protein
MAQGRNLIGDKRGCHSAPAQMLVGFWDLFHARGQIGHVDSYEPHSFFSFLKEVWIWLDKWNIEVLGYFTR